VKADIGNTYASFLPGISVTLCNIITGDTKQGFAVTTVSYSNPILNVEQKIVVTSYEIRR